jgi:hypothetical protein
MAAKVSLHIQFLFISLGHWTFIIEVNLIAFFRLTEIRTRETNHYIVVKQNFQVRLKMLRLVFELNNW